MKKLFYLFVCYLMVACNTSENVGNNDVVSDDVSSPIFHAYFADESSRTYLDGDINLRWNANDLITLFEGTTRNKKYIFLGDDGDNAGDFEYVSQGFGTGNEVNRYYAIYPYDSKTKLYENGHITYTFPTGQTYAEGSVGLGANAMVAVTADLDDYDLIFRNVGSYLRLFLYGTDTTIKSIKIEGHNSEKLAGKAYITPVYKGNPTLQMDDSATTSVTLNCPEGITIGATEQEATPFWIVLPPTTFSQGFTITVTGFYGGTYTKSYNDMSITFERNKYLSAKLNATITPTNGANLGVVSWGDGKSYSGSAE